MAPKSENRPEQPLAQAPKSSGCPILIPWYSLTEKFFDFLKCFECGFSSSFSDSCIQKVKPFRVTSFRSEARHHDGCGYQDKMKEALHCSMLLRIDL